MIYRIKQFIWALRALMSEDKAAWTEVKLVLTEEELKLYNAMSKVDQDHSYRVYEMVKRNLSRERDSISSVRLEAGLESSLDASYIQTLLKACLLHDVGRDKDNFSLWAKVYSVLMEGLLSILPASGQAKINQLIRGTRLGEYMRIYREHPIESVNRLKEVWSRADYHREEQKSIEQNRIQQEKNEQDRIEDDEIEDNEIEDSEIEEVAARIDYKLMEFLIVNHHKDPVQMDRDQAPTLWWEILAILVDADGQN